MMIAIGISKILALTIVLIAGFQYTQALFCLCHTSSCMLIHTTNSNIEHLDEYCPERARHSVDIAIVRYLDSELSSELFSGFPNLTSMEITHGQMTSIPPNTFQNATQLSMLMIYSNPISKLENEIFKGADKLEEIGFVLNKLTVIEENAFANLKNLRQLMLTKNAIKQLPVNLFQPCRSIQAIILNNNEISHIPSQLFDNLDQLERLELGHNHLTTFDFPKLQAKLIILNNNSLDSVAVNEQCTTLHADHNAIKWVHIAGTEMTILSLTGNEVTDIRNLTRQTKLKQLSLSGNAIPVTSEFRQFSDLTQLLLSETHIEITTNTFDKLRKLKLLDLSHNNLTAIDFSMFNTLDSLDTLSVASNKLAQIDFADLRVHLPRLRVLEICANGWNSTYLRQVLQEMRTHRLYADVQGISSSFLFLPKFIEICSKDAMAHEMDSDYSEMFVASEEQLEQDVQQYLPHETVTSSPTGQPASSSSQPFVSPEPEHSTVDESVDSVNRATDSSAAKVAVTEAAVSVPASASTNASSLNITFHVLAYTLAVVGVVALAFGVYYFKQNRYEIRRINSDNAYDTVGLV